MTAFCPVADHFNSNRGAGQSGRAARGRQEKALGYRPQGFEIEFAAGL
jgi:hypothetical protein